MARIKSPLPETENQFKSAMEILGYKSRSHDGRLERSLRLAGRKIAVYGNSHRPLKRQSKGLRAETAKYRKLSTTFLSDPANRLCICCFLRREKLGENILQRKATEVHHWAGRIGRLLCYVPFFKAFCFFCRTWPHEHPVIARQLGLISPPKDWNVFPRDD